MRRTFAAPLIAAAALAMIAATPPAMISTREGVYTSEQADAGAQLYAARCAMCHGKMLEGTYDTPGLQDRFIVNWSKAPLSNLYDYLGRAMPQFAPGSLTPDENAKLVAFLLRANALPAGSKPLPASSAAMERIMLEPIRLAASIPKQK